MKRIILIGYMGAGKTTVGHQLTKRTGLMFYDLDWYIESRHHKTIAEIFATKGEDEFRKIERTMLHEVAEFENVIISCGGGTPCFFDNMEYLNNQGETIYLKCTPDVLFEHLQMGRIERPLLKNKSPEEIKEFIKEQLEYREQFYNQAKYIIDISVMNSPDKIQKITDRVQDILKVGSIN